MALAELLIELKGLLTEPAANQDRIAELLELHSGLAEFEVARFFVTRHLDSPVSKRLRSVDPKERLNAVRMIPLTFPRSSAARLLRKVVKDPSTTVATAARAAVREMGLRDVALPDRRFRAGKSSLPLTPGGWNPSGWWFGLYAENASKRPTTTGTLLKVPNLGALATLLGTEVTDLKRLMRPGTGTGSAYIDFDVPKRTGGTRRISAPRQKLRTMQRTLLDKLLAPIALHPAAHGFVPGRSTVTNAQQHVGASLVVKIDLEDFFPSVHYRRVRGLFEAYGYNAEVSAALAGLTTHRPKLPDGRIAWPGSLPQGAPTSPAIANLICRRLDSRLTAIAKKFDATYTRYADDLSFSFKKPPEKIGRFLWWVNAICQQEGFSENDPKRHLMRKVGRQSVTGLVVNERVAIPRDDRRRFKAILHNVKKNGLEAEARGNPAFASWLQGYAAYVHMVHPALGEKWLAEVRALTGSAP